MKIFKYVFVVVGALLMALAAFGPVFGSSPEVKVTLCHATASESNPYVTVNVSGNSVENKDNWLNGHGGHANDIWPAFTLKDGTPVAAQGDQAILANDCNIPKPTETPVPPTATPVPPTPTTPGPTPTNTVVPPGPTPTTPPVVPPTATPPEQNTAGGTSGSNFLFIGLAGAALFAIGIFFPNAKAKIRH